MDVLLLYPQARSDYLVPPLGLAYLAAALRQAGVSKVDILDALLLDLDDGALAERLRAMAPRMVAVQFFSADFAAVERTLRVARSVLPDATLVLGGAHPSAVGARVLEQFPEADFAFVGEGEPGLPKLARRVLWDAPIAFDEIEGLLYRSPEPGAVRSNERALVADLDSLPLPAWDLVDPRRYEGAPQGAFFRRLPIAPISTSRGCPYPCTFCASHTLMGKELRVRSLDSLLEEVRLLVDRYGVRELHIVDDCFTSLRERCEGFFQALLDEDFGLAIAFPNGVRLDSLDAGLLALMRRAGVYSITVGIESGSDRVLADMKKMTNRRLIQERIALIREAGIQANGFFILGYPTETQEDIEETIRFSRQLGLRRAHFSNFLPLPGTPATRKLVAQGEWSEDDWARLSYDRVSYAPAGIGVERLKRYQRKAFLAFHLRPAVLARLVGDIRSSRHLRALLGRARSYLGREK